jgi:hypothetical protein
MYVRDDGQRIYTSTLKWPLGSTKMERAGADPVQVPGVRVAAAEPLHAPQVLGARQTAPVRDVPAEGPYMASASTVGCRPASRRVDDRRKRRLHGQRGVAAASSLRGRTRTTLPTGGTSRARTARAATWPRCPARGWLPRGAAQLPCAVHLEPDHATAAPRALATVHNTGGDARKRPTSPPHS